MPQTVMKRKKVSVSEGYDSSDDDFVKTEEPDSLDEEDLLEEVEDNGITKVTPYDLELEKDEANVKMLLTKAIRSLPCSRLKYRAGAERVPWDQIKQIEGYSTVDLQKHLAEIIKITSHVRTLDEVLADFEKNANKYLILRHPDYPTKPLNAKMKYAIDHRKYIAARLRKMNNGAKVSNSDVLRCGAIEFNELTVTKKEKYMKNYQKENANFKAKVEEFHKNHPALSANRATTSRKGQIKNSSFCSPILYFRDLNGCSLAAARKMWKELSFEEKGNYIKELVNLETEKPKVFTKKDKKILDSFNKEPVRPHYNAYSVFVKEFLKNLTEGRGHGVMKQAANAWKDATPEEKDRCQKMVFKLEDDWIVEMQAYIATLPEAERSMLEVKSGLQKLIRKRKAQEKARNKKVQSKKIKLAKKTNGFSKKRIHSDSDTSDSDTSESDESESSKMCGKSLRKNSDSSTQSLEKPELTKLTMPEYPSQTTAHFFMKNVYQGNPSKIADAYSKLDPHTKKTYRDQSFKKRTEYLLKLGPYMRQLDESEKLEFQKQIIDTKMMQKEQTEWHNSTGTDKEARDDSSSDDSDD